VKANTARKNRLYPTGEQAERLTSWSHTCRAVWNTALAQRIWAYRSAQRRRLRAVEQCAELTEARREHDGLRDLPAQCAQQVLRQLDQAYDNFWDPDHPAGFPRFKRKRERQGITFPGQAIRVRRTGRRSAQAWLPRLGWVRFRLSRPLGGTVRNATVSRDGLGWHIAFGVHQPEPAEPPVHTGAPVGVDVGIACSVFLSTEHAARQRPDTLSGGEKKRLRGLERRKARQLVYAKKHNGGKYSNRLRRTIGRIAALTARQARRRGDWNHKLTTDLAKNHGLVAVEDLRVKSMSRSAKGTVEQPGRNVRQKAGLNRSIADQGWFEIRPPARVQDRAPRGRAGGGARSGVIADLCELRCPRPRIAAGLRAFVRVRALRAHRARRPQRGPHHPGSSIQHRRTETRPRAWGGARGERSP
jgi:putative transposase